VNAIGRGALLPVPPVVRLTATMSNGDDEYAFWVEAVDDRIWKPAYEDPSERASYWRAGFWIRTQERHCMFDGSDERGAKSAPLRLVYRG
jgi:hypothetical protein